MECSTCSLCSTHRRPHKRPGGSIYARHTLKTAITRLLDRRHFHRPSLSGKRERGETTSRGGGGWRIFRPREVLGRRKQLPRGEHNSTTCSLYSTQLSCFRLEAGEEDEQPTSLLTYSLEEENSAVVTSQPCFIWRLQCASVVCAVNHVPRSLGPASARVSLILGHQTLGMRYQTSRGGIETTPQTNPPRGRCVFLLISPVPSNTRTL